MIRTMPFSGPTITVPPLATEVKLAAINGMLDKNKKPPAKHASSPHVVLSPHHPVHGHNYVQVIGNWNWRYHTVFLDGSHGDCLFLQFSAVENGRYYLLDVTVSTPDLDWPYRVAGETDPLRPPDHLRPQNGHLLYAFIGSRSRIDIQLHPPGGWGCEWQRAELMKAD
jgi:hypothetical protein